MHEQGRSGSTSIKIQVFPNDGAEVDVNPQAGVKAYTAPVNLRDPDRYGQRTFGDDPALNATVRFDLRIIRVGKANTLLVAPKDWSTLSNGSVDGVPSGLHRYVGEQRFVFGLLNVTDGGGDLVSYDLETKKTFGVPYYVDTSGNNVVGDSAGATLVPGYFGNGTRLSGSGSYVKGFDTAKLDWINSTFTVAFWTKPETDYVGGTGWSWSFGRQGLWRMGYKDGAVRFEVTQANSPFTVHFAQAAYPLYAGRWVHLAATMKAWSTRTNLSVFVNGALIAWKNESSYSVKDGSTSLYLGYDEATGGRFKGLVDEFRLYKTVLTQEGIRGLPWFLKGANNLLIPFSLFVESRLYGELNGSFNSNSPFAGATAYGNSNTLSSNLNSRVIQMVIVKNLTLAQAWGILDLARTNSTGKVTSFPFFATSNLNTFGFAISSWRAG